MRIRNCRSSSHRYSRTLLGRGYCVTFNRVESVLDFEAGIRTVLGYYIKHRDSIDNVMSENVGLTRC